MSGQVIKEEKAGEYRDYGYATTDAPHTNAYLLPALESILQQVRGGGPVLEAGCGNGWFSEVLAARGFEVSAFDLSETGIAKASARNSRIDFRVASVYDDVGALFDRKFAAAFSLEVVEHLYDPRFYVKRIHDALDRGGLFVVTTPYHGYIKNLTLAATGKLDAHFTALWDGGHIKFWSRRTLTTLLVNAGFEVIDFRGAGRIPYLWKSMIIVARRRD